MENITVVDVYNEIKKLSKKVSKIELLVMQEEEIGGEEAQEIRKLSHEARKELKEGSVVRV